MKILHVVGARPNFMKIAPIMRAMGRCGDRFRQMLVHTGQHYDEQMSRVFFRELGIPEPDRNLEVGSGTHAEQTARVMLAFEPAVREYQPDWVVVVGDVNSTLACALVCAKLGIRVAHVEAGLRSADRTMPEEVNRVLTDQVSDLLFTSSPEAHANLAREGIPDERIAYVGNVMIDTLVEMLPIARQRTIDRQLGLEREFVLVTLHRPGNVDDPQRLAQILDALRTIAMNYRVVFPVHPRTRQRLRQVDDAYDRNGVLFCDPLGYLDFLALTDGAGVVITDSGGLQEETTFLGVPCVTVRPNTERRITITHGTNRLVDASSEPIQAAVRMAFSEGRREPCRIDGWDGQAGERIADTLLGLRR